jgi:hypothetical protein
VMEGPFDMAPVSFARLSIIQVTFCAVFVKRNYVQVCSGQTGHPAIPGDK